MLTHNLEYIQLSNQFKNATNKPLSIKINLAIDIYQLQQKI